MITVGKFSTPERAHLLRTRLEAGGVSAFLRDEHTIQLNWLYSNALGGVRVEIFEDDFERATEILQPEPDELEPVPCPHCHSSNTERDESTRRFSFLSILLFNLPLPIAKNYFVCRDCKRSWKDTRPTV